MPFYTVVRDPPLACLRNNAHGQHTRYSNSLCKKLCVCIDGFHLHDFVGAISIIMWSCIVCSSLCLCVLNSMWDFFPLEPNIVKRLVVADNFRQSDNSCVLYSAQPYVFLTYRVGIYTLLGMYPHPLLRCKVLPITTT